MSQPMGPAGFELDLRDLLDSLPVMIAVIDREHRYVFVNRPYEALHGCKRDEIEGRPLREKRATLAGAAISLSCSPVSTDQIKTESWP